MFLRSILIIFFCFMSLIISGCAGEGTENNEDSQTSSNTNTNYYIEFECATLGDNGEKTITSDTIKFWLVNGKGEKLFSEPFHSGYTSDYFYVDSELKNKYGIDVTKGGLSDKYILAECNYTNYGKLIEFVPLPNNDFDPAWFHDSQRQYIHIVSSLSDVYTKLYFDHIKKGLSTKVAMLESTAAMKSLFSDSPSYLTDYTYVAKTNLSEYRKDNLAKFGGQMMFLSDNSSQGMKINLNLISDEIVRQKIYGSKSSDYGDLIYATFLASKNNLLTNGDFSQSKGCNQSDMKGWEVYNKATNKKNVSVDCFLVAGDKKSLYFQITSNRDTNEEPPIYGFSQWKSIEGYDLSKLFLEISYNKLMGHLETGQWGLEVNSGSASIVIEYVNKNNEPIGWTNITNITESQWTNSGLAGTPDKITSTNDTKLIRASNVNRGLIVNIGKDLDYFNIANKNNVTGMRIWLVVMDYIGGKQIKFGLLGLLSSYYPPKCNNCKAEAEIGNVNLFTIP